ncbi:glycosyl transferase family group 2-domain-containing protein [Suillus subluteus]|nr:glycosyl transferase family group 2-domain-containing protein [Suillus subluteus]
MAMDYDAYDALLHHIFKQTQGDAWFKPTEENLSAGNSYLAPFEAAVRILNPVVAVKVRSAAVHAALAIVPEDASAIYVDHNTRIQIVPSMAMVPRAEKEQCGAFRDEAVLILWSDNLDNIIPLCRDFEEKLIKLVWRQRTNVSATPSEIIPPTLPSHDNLPATKEDSPEEIPVTEKELTNRKPKPNPSSPFWKIFSWSTTRQEHQGDAEKGAKKIRRTKLIAPIYNGLGCGLSIFFIGTGASMLLQESMLDGQWIRFCLLVTAPLSFCVSLFFSLQIIGNVGMIIGPVSQYYENSRYYSAIKPEEDKDVDSALPHVTIELPVYKESLEQTIGPSVYSLKKAMQTYARQGGTSSIFAGSHVPPHESSPDGFKRAGRFKKASNMNYGLALSLKLEKHLKVLLEEEERGELEDDGQPLEDRALNMACDEIFMESGEKWKPWACNGKSIRMGEIILLVDSDTIVPEDCLRDAARELAESPEVAIIQHESDVMQVAHHYFENGIAHFTRRINKCISLGCANGEIAPFVGHNAFLRWSALQDAAFVDPADGKTKIWSESNVSEDFDMALRLQLKKYVIRWATYSEGDFKEGVSLTVDDELNRWQKYSYGCSELIFNPLVQWWRKGPINKQLRVFVWSNAPVHYKISMMAYMFSYYGIAASAVLSVLNYILLGLAFETDGYYLHSFEVFLAILAVFPGSGNVGFILLEYRLGHRSMWASLVETCTWVPFFFFFFGGLSVHLTTAVLAHMFSYNITWGATKKEVERSNFFIEVPRIIKRFWLALLLSFATFGMIIIFSLSSIVGVDWQIPGSYWAVILPLALVAGSHILFPIVLNPWLMIFSY